MVSLSMGSGSPTQMIFSLPNGLQGYYLANAKGERLDVAPRDDHTYLATSFATSVVLALPPMS